MTTTILDKSNLILPFLLPLYDKHKGSKPDIPFVVGIGGLQGSGKTYTVADLQNLLQAAAPHSSVVAFSIDDFYHTFDELEKLRLDHLDNKLLAHRGEPGTHDIELAEKVFESLTLQQTTKIPFFDKSLHDGRGDRVRQEFWEVISPPIDIILFEGWCAGFRAISDEDIKSKRDASSTTLRNHRLEDLQYINNALRGYDNITNRFDAFIHLDAQELSYVYDWRLEQEHVLIHAKGQGMTDAEVVGFIDGYMPGYELYLEDLRKGVIVKDNFDGEQRQLRIVMGKDRSAVRTEKC